MITTNYIYEEFLEKASHTTRLVFYAALCMLLTSCFLERDHLHDYPYNPDQPHQLTINVHPVGISEDAINKSKLLLEVNADYLNRYKINARFRFLDSIAVPQDIIDNPGRFYLPPSTPGDPSEFDLYVLASEHMPPGIGGYAFGWNSMAVRHFSLYGTTVPHELGHSLGLNHHPGVWNTMYFLGNSDTRDDPRDFTQAQIDTMLGNLYEPIELKSFVQ